MASIVHKMFSSQPALPQINTLDLVEDNIWVPSILDEFEMGIMQIHGFDTKEMNIKLDKSFWYWFGTYPNEEEYYYIKPREGYEICSLKPENFISCDKLQEQLGEKFQVDWACIFDLIKKQNRGEDGYLVPGLGCVNLFFVRNFFAMTLTVIAEWTIDTWELSVRLDSGNEFQAWTSNCLIFSRT